MAVFWAKGGKPIIHWKPRCQFHLLLSLWRCSEWRIESKWGARFPRVLWVDRVFRSAAWSSNEQWAWMWPWGQKLEEPKQPHRSCPRLRLEIVSRSACSRRSPPLLFQWGQLSWLLKVDLLQASYLRFGLLEEKANTRKAKDFSNTRIELTGFKKTSSVGHRAHRACFWKRTCG